MDAALFELNPQIILHTKAEVLETQVIQVPGKKGLLSVVEVRKMTQGRIHSVPRFYYITNPGDTKDTRGGHYHPEKAEILFVQMGSAEFHLIDADGNEDRFLINNPNVAVFVPPNIWHEVTLGPRSLLSVLSPREYDAHESVTDLPTK
jgi:dTDP-4-dehydrorhamnose 3,5-epimerase-like enzyme